MCSENKSYDQNARASIINCEFNGGKGWTGKRKGGLTDPDGCDRIYSPPAPFGTTITVIVILGNSYLKLACTRKKRTGWKGGYLTKCKWKGGYLTKCTIQGFISHRCNLFPQPTANATTKMKPRRGFEGWRNTHILSFIDQMLTPA